MEGGLGRGNDVCKAVFWKPSCSWDWGMSREWQEKRQVAGGRWQGQFMSRAGSLVLKSSREPSRNVCMWGGGGSRLVVDITHLKMIIRSLRSQVSLTVSWG